MANKPDGLTTLTGLRLQAEARLRMTKCDIAAMPVEDVQELVHELQVQQIELEMQNQELRQTQIELEAARDRYADLYDRAPIGYLTLDPKGMILEANLPACRLLGIVRNDLLGQPVIRFVAIQDQPTLLGHFRTLFHTGIRQGCEGGLAPQSETVVRFESMVVSDVAGPRSVARTALLDITERVRAEAQAQAQRLERQRNLDVRERIGHDLHDGILQSLYAIGLSLETCKQYHAEASDQVGAIVTRSIGELNSVLRDVRGFVEELGAETATNAELLPLDLPMSLRTMVQTLARLYSQKVHLTIDQASARTLSPAQSLDILNLVKEALSNSFRHAHATMVQVPFRQLKTGIRLAIRDSGTGLRQPGATGQGQGLSSMAARAHRLGGRLSVQSRPRKGTQVVLDLPKQYNSEDITPLTLT